MTLAQAIDIVNAYEYLEYASCSCHLGNPPCMKCVSMPPKEDYEVALEIIEQEEGV